MVVFLKAIIKKAFDSVDHNFIFASLEKYLQV